MSHARIYLQVKETPSTWCEHRVHDDDVEYVRTEAPERAEAVVATSFACPGCKTEYTLTAAVPAKEVAAV